MGATSRNMGKIQLEKKTQLLAKVERVILLPIALAIGK